MDKEKLIKLAEDLYQSAFDANAYYAIMMQYSEMSKKYNNEMNLSPAFYQVVYGALQKACFMEIAKLYDKTKDVVSVGLLLKYCRDNLDLFPEYRDIVTIKEDGREYSFQVPYQHHLKPTEECFYENEVKSQREILKLFDTPDFEKIPVRVNLTFSEFLELYQKRFCSLSKKQENIRVQRNKIYAHNDEKHILAEENVWDKNPVTYPDIQELIDFALDCTRLILGALTGVSRAVSYGNIDDMEGTLMLAKLGLKYQDYEMEQRHKQIVKEIYADKRSEGNGKF